MTALELLAQLRDEVRDQANLKGHYQEWDDVERLMDELESALSVQNETRVTVDHGDSSAKNAAIVDSAKGTKGQFWGRYE